MKTALISLLAIVAAHPAAAMTAAADTFAEPARSDIEYWDHDGSGEASLGEIRDRRALIFERFDGDGDGYLDVTEFIAVSRAHSAEVMNRSDIAETQPGKGALLGDPPNLTIGQRRANRRADADRDGRVSHSEFINAGSFWLKELDLDGNWHLTASEVGILARPED